MTTSDRADLNTCDREPIHIPGSIQPHGVLLAFDADGALAACSANLETRFARAAGTVLGQPLSEIAPDLPPAVGALLSDLPVDKARLLGRHLVGGTGYTVFGHRSGALSILEFEADVEQTALPATEVQDRIVSLVAELQSIRQVRDGYRAVAALVREISGFDRALVYQFDETWTGTVVAEDRNDVLPSYLDLRFPASDIPAQARDLYRRNRVRQIPDAGYRPVPLVARSDEPIDLSLSVLRSVSPVHVEYMHNMGTAASMSVSILVGDRLWGLISCHNREPLRISPEVRGLCDLIAQILSMRIAVEDVHGDAADRLSAQAVLTRLLAAMASAPSFADGLIGEPDALLALTGADGAAVVRRDETTLIGRTPPDGNVREIVDWLESRPGAGDLTATARLPADMDRAEAFDDAACGLLAMTIGTVHARYVLWFRSEVIRTVTWGGDPRKQFEPITSETRISPRKSFEAWQETVRGTSRPWTTAEIDAARSLRHAIVEILLKRAEEMATLTEDLQRTNQELEAFSYSVSHDLRAPFRHIVGYAELLSERYGERFDDKARHFLSNITESAQTAGKLVDDLLHFSQLGRVHIHPVRIDMNKLALEVQRSLVLEIGDRAVEWRIGRLPSAIGDSALIRQVLYNLVANAVKYTRGREPAVIAIEGQVESRETGRFSVYRVTDNGIGFDMTYADKLFQVFQRLNRAEDFEGTGIGLALVRRIVERHGGSTDAHGEVGVGATFTFSLPLPLSEPS